MVIRSATLISTTLPGRSMSRALSLVLLAVLVSTATGACLRWSDEFSGPEGSLPSTAKWTPEEGDGTNQSIPGWGNQELQYYTRDAGRLDGSGRLEITARAAGAGRHQCYYGPCRFTSARLVSRFATQYGRFEARLRTTAGPGTWPAFWMLGDDIGTVGWPTSGEIDVMEARGNSPDTVSGAIHGPGFSGARALSHVHQLKNGSFADDFHVVAVDWLPDSIKWSVDGVVFGTERPVDGRRWVFDHPFFMVLNLAIGGHYGGQPSSDANFTQRFVVDYVRVYGHGNNCTGLEENDVGQRSTEKPEVAKGAATWASWTVVVLVGMLSATVRPI